MFVGRVIKGFEPPPTPLNTLMLRSNFFWHLFFRNLLCLIISKLLINVQQFFYCLAEEWSKWTFGRCPSITSLAGAEALNISFFQLWGLRVLPRENFRKKNVGANMCIMVHFMDEIRIYGVQDRGVHAYWKSHWNVIPMGVPWKWKYSYGL